ncbi:hypothetical protein [Arthrobacter livingstonensis]|uniref:hypothetical protein n=1 Tax=Arthrobacter livingstonensis TaxID=670078 RepID=UPI001B86DD1C|nr:hypothetical protein [Arthrobacter livingstonensis]
MSRPNTQGDFDLFQRLQQEEAELLVKRPLRVGVIERRSCFQQIRADNGPVRVNVVNFAEGITVGGQSVETNIPQTSQGIVVAGDEHAS